MRRVALAFALAAASLPLSVACGQADAARTRPAPSRFEPEVVAAEALLKRGDRAAARRAADALVDRIEAVAALTSADRTVLGRAYILLGDGDASAVRAALAAFDAARAADPSNLEPELRAGNLFLDKYNAPDARASFETVLKVSPNDASALLGLARVEDFEGKGTALATVRRAVAADPTHADALTMLARLHLEAEQYDSATANARRAIAADSASIGAWALLGATAWLTGDSATYRSAHASATRLQPRPAEFLVELAEAAVRNRRYTDAVRFGEQAVELDPQSTRALGVLGTNQLRIGRMREGQSSLDRAFAIDPFNLWHKNTLDLLDKMGSFRTIDRGRFQVVAPAEEAELLALYVVPMLERAYDSLATRYGYRPPTPVRLEFFRQHADFSVRTVGLAGLGALGVSFGSLLAMDTPSAREQGAFNWGSTALHELVHAFTLGASDHRVPRWLSEGMSVLEERRAGRGWGADASLPFLGALARGALRPMSQLNDGFLRPRHPQETEFSYYQASLFSEMVEAQKGAAALPAMLRAYRDGSSTPEVFQRVLGMTPPQVDAAFDTYIRTKFARPLQSVASADSTRGSPFVRTMQEAVRLMEQPAGRDSARALFTRALAMYPEYGGDDGPAWYLARIERERGNVDAALAAVSQVTTRNETAWEANLLEAELREQKGDDAGAMLALERLLWISPYDPAIHGRLAALATKRGDHAVAVRERRAVIAVNPPDPLDARYELARALVASGDVAGARRELLSVLESAPSFEKAQALLLELRGRTP